MIKINNKGITLVELIVSFAIVGVAMLYFFQTLTTVSKLYETSKKETKEFIEEDYYLRILDAYLDGKNIQNNGKYGKNILDGDENPKLSSIIGDWIYTKSWNGNILVINMTNDSDENKTYTLHKYVDPALIVTSGGI